MQNEHRETYLNVLDHFLNKGLNVDRSRNGLNIDYFMGNSSEDMGLKHYIHRYFLAESHFSYVYAMDENGKLLWKRSQHNELRHQRVKQDMQIILKTIVEVVDSNRLQVYPAGSTAGKIRRGPEFTGRHVLVFENLLKAPPAQAAMTVPYVDWISDHKLPKDNWVLVDIDNYLNGNPYFVGMADIEKVKKAFKINEVEMSELVTEKEMEEMMKKHENEVKRENLWPVTRKIWTRDQMEEKVKALEVESTKSVEGGDLSELSIEALLKRPLSSTGKQTPKESRLMPRATKKQKEKAKAKASAKESGSKKKWKKR